MGLANDRAQSLAGRTGGGISIGQACRYVGDAGTLVERDQLDTAVGTFAVRADEDFPAVSMLEDIGGKLSCDESHPTAVGIAKSLAPRHLGCPSPRLRHLTLVLYGE